MDTEPTSRVRLALVTPCLLVGIGPLTAQRASDAPYTPNALLDVRIRMDPGDWQKLRISHRSADFGKIAESTYVYYKADVEIDGKKIGSVGVRKKGFFGSVISTRPSLKIRFDKFVKKQRLHGLDQLTLNNNVQDPSQLHQYISYWYFRKAGVHAPRCNFALVTVNGEELGVYSNVESIRKPFLRRVFGSAKGDLYEGYAGDFVPSTRFFDRIVHKGRDPKTGRSHLEALRDALSNPPVSIAAVEKLVDVDDFLRFWASEVLIGHWDSYSGNRNNYYLFRGKEDELFHFIPWGADSVFRDPGPFITQRVPKSMKAVGILCRRLWEIPEMRERYRAEMRRQLRDVFVEKTVLGEIDAIEKLLAPRVTVDRGLFRSKVAEARAFIESRRAEIGNELEDADLVWPELDLSTARPERPVLMEVRGTFSTKMARAGALFGTGEGSLKVSIGSEEWTFSNTRSQAQLEDPRFIRPGYPVIRVFGKNSNSKKQWFLSFYVDPIRLSLEKPDMTVDHFSVWAMLIEGSPLLPTARRRIFGATGTLTLDALEQKVGGAVSGSFRIKVPAFGK